MNYTMFWNVKFNAKDYGNKQKTLTLILIILFKLEKKDYP